MKNERKKLDRIVDSMQSLKKVVFILAFVVSFSYIAFGDTTDDRIVTNLSKDTIKIGEKILLTIKVPNLNDIKVLWEDMTSSDNSVDVISKKDYYKANNTIFEIEFTFFNPGIYQYFHFTIPISQNDEMFYLVTDKFDIRADGVLTAEEIKNLKSIEDPSKIVLRKEKDIAKINFTFGPYIKIITIILVLLLIGLILFFILYKFILKKGGVKESAKPKLPPYENFLKNIAQIIFNEKDSRHETENKLSLLTEALKELIYEEFDFNAPTETTKEFVRSLRSNNFKEEIVLKVNTLFTEIDMIKFAKASYTYDNLNYFLNSVKELASVINQEYRLKQSEDKGANL